MVAAAGNDHNGEKIINVLLDNGGAVAITMKVTAAAGNDRHGEE
jgi:hypothetical protein